MQSHSAQSGYGGQTRPGMASNGAQAAYSYQARPQQAGHPPPRTAAAASPAQPAGTAERRRIDSVNLGDGDGQYRQAKKRRATDKSLPTFAPYTTSAIALPAAVEARNAVLASLSSSHSELQRIERKLDWTLSRKRVEYTEAAATNGAGAHMRIPRIRKTLRVTVSNTCANQLWQGAAQSTSDQIDFATGEGIPSWTLRIEGDLVDPAPGEVQDQYRFTKLVERIVVDASRDDMPGQDQVHAEWERQQDTPAQDGLTYEGRASSDLKAQISLWLSHHPERLAVHPLLGSALGITEASRSDLISALWTYIRKNSLLDPDDRKMIRCDAYFVRLWVSDPRQQAHHISQQDLQIPLTSLPELLTRHTGRLPPLKLDFVIKVDGDPASSSQSWDLPIDIEDPVRADMGKFVLSMMNQNNAGTVLEQLGKLDDTISDSASKVRSIKSRRDALAAFSTDPVSFLRVWLASQSADIDQLLNGADRSHQALGEATAEDLRHAEFYRAPWLTDAINLHQGRLFHQKVQEAVAAASGPVRR